MALAALSPKNLLPSSERKEHPQSVEEKVHEVELEVAEKKAQLDSDFRRYAGALIEKENAKLNSGFFFTDKMPRTVQYRTEAKIRKRYWNHEWKKLKLEWRADLQIEKLRGERPTSVFSLLKEQSSPRTGMTRWELRDQWQDGRDRDLLALQTDYEQGNPIQQKYYRATKIAETATPVSPPAQDAPKDSSFLSIFKSRRRAEPPTAKRPIEPAPQPPAADRPIESAPQPLAADRPVEPAPPTSVRIPAAPRTQAQPTPKVAEEKPSNDVQAAVAEIQDSMAKLQEALDRALGLMSEQKSKIAEERVHLINRRTEVANRDDKLKKNAAAFEEDRTLLEAEQRDYGNKALLRDQKKEAIAKEEAAIAADQKAFEEQIERWEVQQRQINGKIKEFHESAAEVSRLRFDIESEKATIEQEETRISKAIRYVALKGAEIDATRKDLKARADTLDEEIAGLESQSSLIEDQRAEMARLRADFAQRQKEFVDRSFQEWRQVSAQVAPENPDSATPDDDEKRNDGRAESAGTEAKPAVSDSSPREEKRDESTKDDTGRGGTNANDETKSAPIEKPGLITEMPLIEEVQDFPSERNNEPAGGKPETRPEMPQAAIVAADTNNPKDVFPVIEESKFSEGLVEARQDTPLTNPTEIEPARKELAADPEKLPWIALFKRTERDNQPVAHSPEKSGYIRDILFETKESLKRPSSGKFEAEPHQTGGFGAAIKHELTQARSRREEIKTKKQEMAQELARAKDRAAQEIAILLKSRDQTNLIKSDDAMVAKLVNKLIDERSGQEIIRQYKRAQKEATQEDGSKIILEGMQISMKNMRISMSNAGGRVRYAAGRARDVSLTCTEGLGRLVSTTARNRLATQQQPREQTNELR